MCGIWGYQFPISVVHDRPSFTARSILTSLLMCAMEERGQDSWGFAVRVPVGTPDAPSGIAVIKNIGPCTKLVDPRLVASTHQVVAHTRKASQGAVCKANAHPFQVKTIVGVHNGHVSNHHDLNTKYTRTCDVDSEHIFHHLANKQALDELDASGAVVWVDTDTPDAIHLVRSHSGQLSVYGIGPTGCAVTETEAIVWCSTEPPLVCALAMAGYDSFEFRINAETHYVIEGGKITTHEKMAFCPTALITSSTSVGYRMNGVWRRHPILGTSCKCDAQGDKILRWHLNTNETALIMKWRAGTLTTTDAPHGRPDDDYDGVDYRPRKDRQGHSGSQCGLCLTYREFQYMTWDTTIEKFACWNCRPASWDQYGGEA